MNFDLLSSTITRRVLPLVLFVLCAAAPAPAQNQTPAGANIFNRARLVYTEPDGDEIVTETPTVSVTVAVVNGVVVTPDEAASSGLVGGGESAAVRFAVCNAGNNPTPFVIVGASVSAPARVEAAYLDADSSGTVTADDVPVSPGVTRTPVLNPGECSPALVVFATGGASPDTVLSTTLTAQSPQDGAPSSLQPVQDTGTIIRTVRPGPRLKDPEDPNLPPRKSVNGGVEVTAGGAGVVEFEIAIRNVGEGVAVNTSVVDELPAGLTYRRGTLRLAVGSEVAALSDERDADGGEVVGQTIEVRVPRIDPQEVVRLTFSAHVAHLPGGTVLVNRGQVTAANAPLQPTRDVRVIIAPQGMVFDGGLGSAAPVGGALVRVVAGSPRGQLAVLAAPGFAPNGDNSNPYRTGADGLYSFRLPTPPAAGTFYILVDAPEFKSRVIEATATPRAGGLYQLRLTSQDGQPLCAGGGFTLTEGVIELDNLAALVTNIPLFTAGALQVAKTVDRASASIGDVVTYRVEVKNTSRNPAYGVVIRDTLPQSFHYVPGSGVLSLGGAGPRPVEPEIRGDDIVFRLARVGGGETAAVTYRVRIGVNARTGEQFNTAVALGGAEPTPPARVGLVVRGGVFSTNQFLVGRVYADLNRDGRFDKSDRPVASARLITSGGRVALTDANGNFNFPVIPEGALVVQLDPSSVPAGLAPREAGRSDGAAWGRVVATPLQGGAMLQLSFALEPAAADPGATDALSRGGRERGGSAVSLGRRGAGPLSSDRAETEPRPRKKRSWVRRFFGALFGSSSARARGSNAESHSPPAALVGERAAPSPAPAVAARPADFAPAQYLTTAVAKYSAVTPGGAAGRPEIITVTTSAPPASAAAPTLPAHPLVVTAPLVAPASSGAGDGVAPPAPSDPGVPAGVAEVDAGDVALDIAPGHVLLKPGLDVPVRVQIGWGVRLYVNGVPVDARRAGETRTDQGSRTQQITFVGLDLVAGPNRLRAVAVSPDGHDGTAREVVVYGRGPAVRLVLEPAQAEISAGRRASTEVVLRAFDEWGNPAQDGEVSIQTTAGAFASSSKSGEAALPRATEIQQQSTLRLRGGVARVQLVSDETPGTARITAAGAVASAEARVRFGVEDMPRVVVGYGSLSFGRAAPANLIRGVDDERVRGSMAFFFRGRVYKDQLLTISYDSQRPLQRLDGRDRLFQTDPLENQYSVFGDTSTRFNSAPSNTKVYARWDLGREYGRSFLMFGDFMPEKRDTELAAYNRRLTGAQFHFENRHGDFVSFGGAHPDTLFGRDVFPGGAFGFSRLSAAMVLPGSESVVVETRDRRNPDLVVHREQLVRGVDYNLEADSGQIFFKRVVDAFDADLNLRQIVVTYEYAARGMGTIVYTARASKHFRSTGTRIGFSVNAQQQGRLGNFALGGVDFTQKTPRGGVLHLEYARSTGKVAGAGTYFSGAADTDRQGNAYLATYDQPLGWRRARLQASFRRAGAGFYNPFGATVVGGSQRAGASLELQATKSARLRVGFTDERNRTENVDNDRQTITAQWTQRIRENLTATLAYDYRRLSNDGEGSSFAAGKTNSHLVTAGIEWKPTDRLTLSARREQNLSDSDPTYPNQTVFSGYYKLNDVSRLFVTQRLASAPISPISDLTGGGFTHSQSRREFAAGIETKLGRDTSLVGGYRVEDGLTGTDGYAILGLARSWKLSKKLSLDGSFERAFHLTGRASRGYNTLAAGLTWKPREDFIANASYQWRNREGSGHTLAAGFAGKPFDRVTALGTFQWSRGSGLNGVAAAVSDSVDARRVGGRQGVYGSFGIALRPLSTDRYAAFFNYQHRSSKQDEGDGASRFLTGERSNTLSADAFLQAAPKLSLFGKAAVKQTDSSRAGVVSSPTLTYLLQGRAEYRVARRWDFAIESRFLSQPASRSSRVGMASEVGHWATPDIRFGLGYNFNRALEPGRAVLNGDRRGFYFNITTKFERVFDFFGARKKEDK